MKDVFIDLLEPAECSVPYSVSQINKGITDRIESGNTVIWFVGEISNFKRQFGSGHCYLRLKDNESQIPAVIWNSNAATLKFNPEDGMEVTGIASVRVYQKGGYYQLDIHRMQPSGLGALNAAFEALKKKLAAEGLFDEDRKKPLPESVAAIGVVTSKSGAAIRDIVRVVLSRAPHTTIILRNVAVQGAAAAAQIADAIGEFNAHAGVDLLIVGRGGGSIEDLWAFNEEIVARAIAASEIPVISAIGHETDFTIADFVADQRAATPSAAAEMAVPDLQEQKRLFDSLANRFVNGYAGYFSDVREQFDSLLSRPGLKAPTRLISENRQSLDEASSRCFRTMGGYLRAVYERIRASGAHLQAVSPLNILSRGYSVVTLPGGVVVSDSARIKQNDEVRIRFKKGEATAVIRTRT